MTKKNIIFSFTTLFLVIMLFTQIKPTGNEINIEEGLLTKDTLMYLNIPIRSNDAIKGSDFSDQITGLSLKDRETAIVKEILSGNVPSFSRKLRPLQVYKTIGSDHYELTFYTVCDYMAIGSEMDYLYVPMTPSTAQFLADQLDCSLPTKKIVDIVYTGAGLKLDPQPIPPSDKMITVPVFSQHTDSIKLQISKIAYDRSADSIIAGHKKDIIISNKIYSTDRSYDRVVIYGWHLSMNNPIQPVYNGHSADYADYSHGVRLISNIAFINEDSVKVANILQDIQLSVLLSSEGKISKPYYPASEFLTSMRSRSSSIRPVIELCQNYPNPVNPSTTIKYSIPSRTVMLNSFQHLDNENPDPSSSGRQARNDNVFVQLKVYDILGREVATLVNKKQIPGNYSVQFNATYLTSGIYFYRLNSGEYSKTKKLMILK